MKQSTVWIIVLVIIILAVGAWFVFAKPGAQEAVQGTGDDQEQEFADDSKDGGAAVSAFTVRYTSAGFSPASIAVPVGTTVTFVNQGSEEMWVGSDEHPTHTGYDGTSREEHCAQGATPSFDQCGVGTTYTFTFTKAGTWDYHNHRDASHRGTIIVQ